MHIIIYPGNHSLEFALMKTCSRVSYFTLSRNVLSYRMDLRKAVPTELLLPGGRHDGIVGRPFSFAYSVEGTVKNENQWTPSHNTFTQNHYSHKITIFKVCNKKVIECIS